MLPAERAAMTPNAAGRTPAGVRPFCPPPAPPAGAALTGALAVTAAGFGEAVPPDDPAQATSVPISTAAVAPPAARSKADRRTGVGVRNGDTVLISESFCREWDGITR